MSHEQILDYLLRAVCSRHPTPHIFTVGTHIMLSMFSQNPMIRKTRNSWNYYLPVKDYVIYKRQMLTNTIFLHLILNTQV